VDEPTRTWPHKELGKRLSNWGRWGKEDQLGTLNFVTAEKRVAAGRLIRTGKVFDLGMPFDAHGPQIGSPYRFNPIHLMSLTPLDPFPTADGLIGSDDVVIMGLQSATQWDALCHIGYDGLLYNDTPADAVSALTGATRNSFANCVERLLSRGVLLDIARLHEVDRLADSTEVTAEDLDAATARQQVEVASGDILLIRTGAYRSFSEGDLERYMGPEPGLGLSCLEWLHQHEVAAIALDNYAVEVMPPKVKEASFPFHMAAIRDMGLTLGEMFNLEELASDCEEDRVWDFLFTGTGLKVSRSAGSPVTPLAVK
jgi:kynurenine formamidase